MKNVLKWLDRHLEEVLLVAATIVLVLVIFFQVLARYFLNQSLAWSEELARYVFVWSVWLAVPYTVTRGRHIRLEILPDLVGPKAKFVLDMVFFLGSAAFFGFIGYHSIAVVQGISKMNQVTPAMEIPKDLCYLCLPVGGALMALSVVADMLQDQFPTEAGSNASIASTVMEDLGEIAAETEKAVEIFDPLSKPKKD